MTEQIKRKTPDELVSKSKKQPLSTRVKIEVFKSLLQISKENGTTVSDLSAKILEDYVSWFEKEGIKLNNKNIKKR